MVRAMGKDFGTLVARIASRDSRLIASAIRVRVHFCDQRTSRDGIPCERLYLAQFQISRSIKSDRSQSAVPGRGRP